MEEQAVRIQKFGDIQPDKICYWWQGAEKVWYMFFPRCGAGSLRLHTVTENADGTITVTPSILIEGQKTTSRTTTNQKEAT